MSAALLAGCGGNDATGIDDERAQRDRQAAPPAPTAGETIFLAERETSSDLVSWSYVGPVFRPAVDLVAAGIDTSGDALSLRVVTAAPARATALTFTGTADERCFDNQLTVEIEIDADRTATVRASDEPDRRPRRVSDATVAFEGNEVVLDLPLLARPAFTSWYVYSEDTSTRWSSFDSIPDWYIEGAYFTRGYGTPNYPLMCGPADPPLLER